MKRMLTILVLALALAALPSLGFAQAIPESDILTPRPGFAVAAPQNPETGGTVELYEKPDVYSRVLMAYYSGAPLEVVRTLGDLVQVQSGSGRSSVMGYMRAAELRYGAQAAREVPLCYAILEFDRETTVHSYPDEQSSAVGQTNTLQSYCVCGQNVSDWTQLFEPSGAPADDCGFVFTRECIRESSFQSDPYTFAVPPLESELTHEAAYEQAIAYLLDGESDAHGFMDKLPEALRTEEGLRSMKADVRLWKHRDGSVDWNVALEDPQNIDNNICVEMEPAGGLIRITRGNG